MPPTNNRQPPCMIHDNHTKPVIAISSCLLGENVRYDGIDKANALVIETLSEEFELLPICPEVAIGMGVPRLPIQLLKLDDDLRLCGVEDASRDVTAAMHQYAGDNIIHNTNICGYVLKARSPSCGLVDVPVFDAQGDIIDIGAGLYAGRWISERADLPLIDEEMFAQQALRDQFITRVYEYQRRTMLVD